MNWLLLNIESACNQGKIVDRKKLSAIFSLEQQTTPKTFDEIMGQLEVTGRIVIKKDEVFSKKAWEAEKIIREDNLLRTQAQEKAKEGSQELTEAEEKILTS